MARIEVIGRVRRIDGYREAFWIREDEAARKGRLCEGKTEETKNKREKKKTWESIGISREHVATQRHDDSCNDPRW
jgi:hypothetical protein